MATLKGILNQFSIKDRDSLVKKIEIETLEKFMKNKSFDSLVEGTFVSGIKDAKQFKSKLKNFTWHIQCEESDLKEHYSQRINWDNMQRSMYNVGRKDLNEKKQSLTQVLTILSENKVL